MNFNYLLQKAKRRIRNLFLTVTQNNKRPASKKDIEELNKIAYETMFDMVYEYSKEEYQAAIADMYEMWEQCEKDNLKRYMSIVFTELNRLRPFVDAGIPYKNITSKG